MVCMPGHWKMAAVLKLLMVENRADGTQDEVINEKIAAQILPKEFFDAYEPNLLEEGDMHVFGLKPMADPLELVCCNVCQKPVKASQYAAHAERCSSVKPIIDGSVDGDGDGDAGQKPPRKGRKIAQTSSSNQKVHIKVRAKSKSRDATNVKGSRLNHENQSKFIPSSAGEAQIVRTSINHGTVGNTSEIRLQDAPAPLATKMYHSHGNYRLRLELGHLYRQAYAGHSSSYPATKLMQENIGMMGSQVLLSGGPSHGAQMDHDACSFGALQNSEQLMSKNAELCTGISQELSTSTLPNQLKHAKSLRNDQHVSAVRNETATGNYSKMAVPHAGSSGATRTRQQQPNGTVPVT